MGPGAGGVEGGAELTPCPSPRASPGREEIWYKREGPINLYPGGAGARAPSPGCGGVAGKAGLWGSSEVLQGKFRANGTPKLGEHLRARLAWKPLSTLRTSWTNLSVHRDPELKVSDPRRQDSRRPPRPEPQSLEKRSGEFKRHRADPGLALSCRRPRPLSALGSTLRHGCSPCAAPTRGAKSQLAAAPDRGWP